MATKVAPRVYAEIEQSRPFARPRQEALVTLTRTADVLRHALERDLAPHGVSPEQYNVLRILRGAGGELPCSEIAERMVTRVPDITRLIDRLVQTKWVTRRRSRKDRRVVLVRITESGLTLLEQLDQPVRELRQKLFAHMTADELDTLNQLLVKVRTPG